MVSAVTLPSFTDEEILLFQKLNAAMSAINARFLAGIGSADLAWPLVAEGDLDMSVYSITGGYQIWGFVNAGNYATLSDALTAAGSGGVVLVPPETTVTTAGGETFEGNGAAVIGAGPSSVIKFTGSPTAGYLLRSTTGTGLLFADLTFDGNVEAGSSQVGLDLLGVTNVTISRVNFKNFSGAAVKISSSCSGVKIGDCAFDGGAAEHIYATHSGQLTIANCTSDDAGGIAIRLESSGASATIQATLTNVIVTNFGNYGIRVLGNGAAGSTSPASFHASGCVVDGAGSTHAVAIGSSTAVVHSCTWNGGRINGAAIGGLLVNANGGSISGVEVNDPGTFCIDLDTSQYMEVSTCVLRDGTIGVDASAVTAECRVHDNLYEGCTANVVLGGTGLVQYGNGAQVGVPATNAYGSLTDVFVALGTATVGCTITIPADVLRSGACLSYSAAWEGSGTADTGAMSVRFDGDTIGQATMAGNGIDSVIMGRMMINGATTAEAMSIGTASVTDVDGTCDWYTLTGIDLTTSIEVDVRVAPHANVSGYIRGLIVTLDHAEDQST